MTDKDFDKIFGDQLRQEGSFPKDDGSDWERLVARLEGEKWGGGFGFWQWLTPLLLLFLTATSGYFLWKNNATAQQNDRLSQQIDALKNTTRATEIRTHDTVFVLKRDTIFIDKNAAVNQARQDKTLSSKKENPKFSSSNQPAQDPSVFRPNSERVLLEKIYALEKRLQSIENQKLTSDTNFKLEKKPNGNVVEDSLKNLTEKLADAEKQVTILTKQIVEKSARADRDIADLTKQLADKTNSLSLKNTALETARNVVDSIKNALKKLPPTNLAASDSTAKTPLPDKNRDFVSLNSTKPKIVDNSLKVNRLFIGLNGGFINYHTTWQTPQGVDVSKNIGSYQVGLKLEYALTDRLRLMVGGDYCPVNFEIFWRDDRYNLPKPTFDPTTEKLLKTDASQRLLQGLVGAKYFFTNETATLRPYVAAGYTLMNLETVNTHYVYQQLIGSWTREEQLPSNSRTITNLLLLGGGVETRLSRRFVGQIEAFYYKDLNAPQRTFDLFGLRGAVLMRF